MKTSELLDLAQSIIAGIAQGMDEYDTAKELNKLYHKGVQDGIDGISRALAS